MSSYFVYFYIICFVQMTVTVYNNKPSWLDLLSGFSYSHSHTQTVMLAMVRIGLMFPFLVPRCLTFKEGS